MFLFQLILAVVTVFLVVWHYLAFLAEFVGNVLKKKKAQKTPPSCPEKPLELQQAVQELLLLLVLSLMMTEEESLKV